MRRSSVAAMLCLAALAACGSEPDGAAQPPAGPEPEPPETAPGPSPGDQPEPPGAIPADPAIKVEFKLDPRLTSGVYLGARWVSPPVFTALDGHVEARARCLVPSAGSPRASVSWSSADPSLASVSRSNGDEVRIDVHRAGEAALTLTCEGQSRTLWLRAELDARGTLRVEISQ